MITEDGQSTSIGSDVQSSSIGSDVQSSSIGSDDQSTSIGSDSQSTSIGSDDQSTSIGSPTSHTPPRPGDSSGFFHATTIALACVLSIVLFLVIFGAGVWYLRRRGKLPAFMTKNRSPNEPSTELEVQAAKRAPIPTPPALGSAEYSFAYGQRPDTGGANAMNKDNDEYHYYSSLDKDGVGEKSARHVKDGLGSVKVPSREAPSDHDYFALVKADKDEDANVQDGGHNEVVSSPEDDDDHTYFPLQKTPERPSGNANSGYEVPKPAPTSGSEAEEASL
ncbi:uncharacterized protein LOC119726842 [Patiria miniata]|uniref:Uncharacterized protein n=1 Tax=Patiria miniata TaxID=46514 RepID=A0A913ZTU2_PATMI|nr:uncharacterized protein LOC119726842 [Patiria miniata]